MRSGAISKETTRKYLYFLNSLKSKIDNKEVESMEEMGRIYKVSNCWASFLNKNGVIYKRNGLYYWNDKIPVSIKLVNKYRNYKYIENQKRVALKVKNQTKIVFDKKEIKKSVDKFTPIKTEQKVGIIRKFLRWLW
jgi:hypothetical protein